jgi:hypothetical protein
MVCYKVAGCPAPDALVAVSTNNEFAQRPMRRNTHFEAANNLRLFPENAFVVLPEISGFLGVYGNFRIARQAEMWFCSFRHRLILSIFVWTLVGPSIFVGSLWCSTASLVGWLSLGWSSVLLKAAPVRRRGGFFMEGKEKSTRNHKP